MKNITLILTLLIFGITNAFSQDSYKALEKKLFQADSVLLISHKITQGVVMMDDSTGKIIPLPKLIINGRPNENIIQERKLITGKYLNILASIFNPRIRSKTIIQSQCFMPHHAIFIFKKSKISHIEICFGCRKFETSIDLNDLFSLSENKWKQLEEFFITLGFKYELY